MSIEWIMNVSPRVFTRIKSQFSKEIKESLNMSSKNFSTVNSTNKNAVFPFVFVSLLPAVEHGRDLEGDSINCGLFTFQIDVIDNQSQERTRTVMTEIIRVMKLMKFEIVAMPNFEDTNDAYRMTTRFRRAICEDDEL